MSQIPTQVIKRDGSIVDYNRSKIRKAIERAMKAVDYKPNEVMDLIVSSEDNDSAKMITNNIDDVAGLYAAHVEKLLCENINDEIPTIEMIQDIVEDFLIKYCSDTNVAKSYIIYRNKHGQIRKDGALMLDIENTMDGYLGQSDWRVNENSSINYSIGGLILHNNGAITANYWLNKVYDEKISNAHRDGSIHIHDLCMFSGYCAGWSLRQLIMEGISGIPGKTSSAPAKHLSTLVNQMVNFLGILQNEWAGAQAFSSVDTYLAPFVWADNLPYESVKQCVQSLIYGLNISSRWGMQSPFTNVTFDWVVPNDMKDQPAIIGGKPIDKTYGDFQKEMDMINKAFLEVFVGGDAEGRGFAYPIPTYNITEEFNWDSENANLLFAMTSRFGTPYFQNFVNSDLNPGDVRSMCCRLQLSLKELTKRGGGLFGSSEFTGSIGVVTINMGRIGYIAKDEEEYFKILTEMMDIARDSLEIKRKIIIKLTNQGLFPYTRRFLKHWNNHFSTIGLIGMNESTMNLMGKDLTTSEANEFTIKVLNYMRDRLIKYQQDTGNLYNLEATPGEGTSYRLAKIDRERYPDIFLSGGESDPYYTNSTQLPVDCTDDIFEALDLQEEVQKQYTGGTVFHAHLGESIDDVSIVKSLVKKIAYNYRIPYFTLSPEFSICEKHGYFKGKVELCPICGSENEIYARIVGYYRPVKQWNKGKKSEFSVRTTFKLPEEVEEK